MGKIITDILEGVGAPIKKEISPLKADIAELRSSVKSVEGKAANAIKVAEEAHKVALALKTDMQELAKTGGAALATRLKKLEEMVGNMRISPLATSPSTATIGGLDSAS